MAHLRIEKEEEKALGGQCFPLAGSVPLAIT
jgi:hypothetical protein